jgi:addiction module HigA family antidote
MITFEHDWTLDVQDVNNYISEVIIGYADDATRDVHTGVDSRPARRFGRAVRVVARRKLDLLGAAGDVRDLAIPPGNRFEKLKGDLAGFFSIRVNEQFRIIFKFEAGNASAVQIVDYHWGGTMLTTAPMKRRPTLPGVMLLEEYLKPAGITQVALAEKMAVPIQRVNGIIAGRRAVTAETAILLSRALGTTAELWLNLQVAVDLWNAQQRLVDREEQPRARTHATARRRKVTLHRTPATRPGSQSSWNQG